MTKEGIDEYFIFAEILEDDYDIMVNAILELGGTKDKYHIIFSRFERMNYGSYLEEIKSILLMPSCELIKWKDQYKKTRVTLFDFMG